MSEFQIGSIIRIESGPRINQVGAIINKAIQPAELGWYILLETGARIWSGERIAEKCKHLGLIHPGCAFLRREIDEFKVVITEIDYTNRRVAYKGCGQNSAFEIMDMPIIVFLRVYTPCQDTEEAELNCKKGEE